MKKTDMGIYEAFFFDFDGVIADSVNIKTEAFAELYEHCPSEAVTYVIRHHKAHGGMSRFLKIRHYHKELLGQDLSDDELERLTDRFSDLVLTKVVEAAFINGAMEFIRMLHEHGKKMFIVSGTPEEEIRRIVREKQLESYFMEVKGAPVAKSENIDHLLKKYKINASGSVFFGDSPEDLKAASSSGIEFIPINYFDADIEGYKDFTEFMNDIPPEERY
jgi:beta-phosphoglucomutase-like phosphatase (HAD superfamily)